MFLYLLTYIIIPSCLLSRCYVPVVAPVMSHSANNTCKSEHSHCGCDLIFSSTETRQTPTAASVVQQVCPSQVKLFGCNSLAKSIGFIFLRGFISYLTCAILLYITSTLGVVRSYLNQLTCSLTITIRKSQSVWCDLILNFKYWLKKQIQQIHLLSLKVIAAKRRLL